MREEGFFPLFLGMVRTSLRQSCEVCRIGYLLLIASIIGSCIISFFLLESLHLRIRPELRIDMKSDASNAVRQQLLTILQSIPGVNDVVYVTRERALQNQKQNDPQFVELLTTAGLPNPFNDALLLTLSNSDVRSKIAEILHQAPYTSAVDASIFPILSQAASQSNNGIASLVTTLVVPIQIFILIVSIIVLLVVCLCIERSSYARNILLQNFGASFAYSFFLRWFLGVITLLYIFVFAGLFVLFLDQVLMKVGSLPPREFTSGISLVLWYVSLTSITLPFFTALIPLQNTFLFPRE